MFSNISYLLVKFKYKIHR